MSASEIIQIALSALSLIATVAVSVIIYKFERKHEKIREEDLKRQKTKETEINYIVMAEGIIGVVYKDKIQIINL